MLGKLLKHEFRATGRTMLPVLGVLTALVLLANLSVRFGDGIASRYKLAAVLFVLIVIAAVIAVIAAEVMSIVVMVQRFYKNLLGDEGYLMHTLPANVHELVWSKLIVSLAWILATNVLIFLLGALSLMNLGQLSVGEVINGFPSWAEVKAVLTREGLSMGDLWLLGLEMLLLLLAGELTVCLHFYGAMSLGHMFSKDKVLLSIVFFVGFNFLFSIISGLLGYAGIRINEAVMFSIGTVLEGLRWVQGTMASVLGYSLLQGLILYLATVFGLKKGLNLA